MKVLFIDDILQNINIISHILKQEELNISVAPSTQLIQEIISKDKPSLVLFDIMMPGIDDYKLIKIDGLM